MEVVVPGGYCPSLSRTAAPIRLPKMKKTSLVRPGRDAVGRTQARELLQCHSSPLFCKPILMHPTPASDSNRLAWLDQYRGYTVLAMFVVNFVGPLHAFPAWLKHHNTYCSYADTIMPQFFFAVGFSFRLTFLRRLAASNWLTAAGHAVWRNLLLILIGFVIYGLGSGGLPWSKFGTEEWWQALSGGFKREFFQTLVHIGVTSLWVLPVIAAGPGLRLLWLLGSALLHLYISEQGYYAWVNTDPKGIDGGPLGFLTWTIPLLVGSLACDALTRERPRVVSMAGFAVYLMLVGYGLACLNRGTPPNSPPDTLVGWLVEPPFVPPSQPVNLWTMSQRSGSVSYLTFAAGFSLAVALVFLGLTARDGGLPLFEWPGRNALAAYILHGIVNDTIKTWTPRDAPLWYGMLSLGLFLAICYLFLWHLHRQRLFLKL